LRNKPNLRKELLLILGLVTAGVESLNESVKDLLDRMRQPFKISCDSPTLGLNL